MGMKHFQQQGILGMHEKFNRIVALAWQIEKTPRSYGTDELLSSSEIHLIEVVGDQQEVLSVTDLSKQLGVTKGAVSQNLKKLENKGLTTKTADPENSSRAIVKLTYKGKTAYFAHKHWHETMDGGYLAYFSRLEQEKIDFLDEFLTKVEDFMQRILQEVG
jgi:DNA-binding MarR family transcriptional regulator